MTARLKRTSREIPTSEGRGRAPFLPTLVVFDYPPRHGRAHLPILDGTPDLCMKNRNVAEKRQNHTS